MWRRTTTSRFFRPADLRYGWVACGFPKHFTRSLPELQIRQKFIRIYAMCSFTYLLATFLYYFSDIFMTKDAIWDDMLPLLLILSRCELGCWNKFISWNFLYLGTFLWQRKLYKTVFCCFYWVRLCLELILSHEKKIM